jgi:hypothetical protein
MQGKHWTCHPLRDMNDVRTRCLVRFLVPMCDLDCALQLTIRVSDTSR